MVRPGAIALATLGCVVAGATSAVALPPLKPGKVEVAVVAADTNVWNPRANAPVEFVVRGRVRPSQAKNVTVLVRYGARGKCGPSYARGRGVPYGPFRTRSTNREGYFAWKRGGAVVITRPGIVRLCVWPAPGGPRFAPISQDVWFYDTLFGAALTTTGSFWKPAPWRSWAAGSTNTLITVEGGTSCAGDRREPVTTTTEPFPAYAFASFDWSAGPVGPAAEDQCNELTTINFRERTLTGEVDRGTLSMTGAERRSFTRSIKAIGPDCALRGSHHRSVAEARGYLLAVGCVPGRMVARRSSLPESSVVGFEIHGSEALVARKGTTVDLVVSDPRVPARP